jgi:hypothetical protein
MLLMHTASWRRAFHRSRGGLLMTGTITILSPVPEPAAQPASAWPAAAVLPERIRLGILSNGKPNSAPLLDGVVEVLTCDRRVRSVVRLDKGTAARGIRAEMLERLVREADVVVNATAD